MGHTFDTYTTAVMGHDDICDLGQQSWGQVTLSQVAYPLKGKKYTIAVNGQ